MCGASKCIFSMLFPTMICSKFQETLTWKDRYHSEGRKKVKRGSISAMWDSVSATSSDRFFVTSVDDQPIWMFMISHFISYISVLRSLSISPDYADHLVQQTPLSRQE